VKAHDRYRTPVGNSKIPLKEQAIKKAKRKKSLFSIAAFNPFVDK
jgi:hypothetical protein